MRVIVDRFEGEYAVVELPDRTMVNIPAILMPDAAEGTVLDIIVNHDETEARKIKIEKLMNDLWAD